MNQNLNQSDFILGKQQTEGKESGSAETCSSKNIIYFPTWSNKIKNVLFQAETNGESQRQQIEGERSFDETNKR